MDPREGTTILTQQITDFLSIIKPSVYSQPLSIFNGSSVGQHIRHVIDFYLCLLNGINESTVDYDNRSRNAAIELDKEVAQTFINQISTQVKQLPIAKMVTVNSCFTPDCNTQSIVIESSVGRELMYAYDHAIHHLAMIKIGMNVHFPDISIDKDLGVAPSTIKYRQQLLTSEVSN